MPEVSRFLTSSNQFSVVNARVKKSAFMPPPTGGTSVFLVDDLISQSIWDLAAAYVAPARGAVLARADLDRASIYRADLNLRRDDTPPLHAIIEGWPAEKDRVNLAAIKLAESSRLVLPADP